MKSTPFGCACNCRPPPATNQQGLGLDELMIVNPAPAFESWQRSPRFFLGDDGTLYRTTPHRSAPLDPRARPTAPAREAGRYFLGADGTLYEVVK